MFDFLSKKGFLDTVVGQAASISQGGMRKIVFADSESFILQAASLVKKKRIAQPVIMGEAPVLLKKFSSLGLSNLDEENICDYLLKDNKAQLDEFIAEFIELRKKDGKPISDKDAADKISRPHYFGAMMVKKGLASGMISGASSKTKPYFPVFEIIKLAPGVGRTNGMFIMTDKKSDKVFFFADCVMNMNPDSEQLAEIGKLSAATCASFGLKPRVAMLSFSTRDSAKNDSVERVKLATAILKRNNPDLIVDGEIQLDAAIDPEVAKRKCPDSPLKGHANVLVFPDLNSANIGYKLVERLAGYDAVGPFLQGLRLPVNDLSRGVSAEDVMYVAAVTVVQSKAAEAHKDAPEEADGNGKAGYHTAALGKRHHPAHKGSGKKYDPLDSLPSNVRKIIEESRAKAKKEQKEEQE